MVTESKNPAGKALQKDKSPKFIYATVSGKIRVTDNLKHEAYLSYIKKFNSQTSDQKPSVMLRAVVAVTLRFIQKFKYALNINIRYFYS